MRVLFLDHPEPDFMSAMLYLGLKQVLGDDDVVDWPWQPHFHGEAYHGPVPGNPNGYAEPFPWMPALPGRKWGDDEVLARLQEFDVVALASPRAYNTERLSRLPRPAKTVIVDGEDYSTLRWDLIEKFKPAVYFKTSMQNNPFEVYPAEQRARLADTFKLVAFPLATTFVIEPTQPKKMIDVCFLGGGNWHGPRREGVTEDRPLLKPELERLLRSELPNARIVTGNVAYSEFRQTLSASKIAVCVSGHGLEPVRTYEAMSCPGTMVIRERIDHVTPWPLQTVSAEFGSYAEVPALCRHYLEHDDERRALALEGNKHVLSHYTPSARAWQFLSEVA